eukprot:Cvel_23461.t1-p1 / transcript=Cvel_23461.t1 / gene=Cvel_23461 / organism=Chromera_velia_CCMP2878 / gene_product=hypothetical protein / transcript_product=hypothetical protein / location=Cvel_scaffold2420:557-1094(-) / protein_length=75 / sequence_SO=supercontig / SO=protein_coding / is_pseudo=false
MAGQSEKKTAKKAGEAIQYYFFAIGIVSVLHLFCRAVIWRSSLGWSGILGFVFFSLVNMATYNLISSDLSMGLKS